MLYGMTILWKTLPRLLGMLYRTVHMAFQVQSPTHVSKSQHGGKVPTFEPQETIKIWLTIIKVRTWLFYAQKPWVSWLRVSSSLLLSPTLDKSPKPHLQKTLTCTHPCHTDLKTPCKVISPNFHALDRWDCTDWPQVNWDLGLGTLCEPTPN